MELHAHRLEILQPREGVLENLANEDLVGDAVIAGDDLAQNSVDIVLGKRHDHPGIGEGGVAGTADGPGIHKRHPRAGFAVALRAQCREHAAGAAADDEHVGFGEHAVKFLEWAHHGRGLFLTEGCTSTICSGQKISQLKQVMQCSRYLMTGRRNVDCRPAIPPVAGAGSIWMTSAGQTTSQMPQPVHLSSSMASIICGLLRRYLTSFLPVIVSRFL